jgi:hypothetical protein
VPDNTPEPDASQTPDEEDGPHSSHDTPRNRAHDAPSGRRKPRSQDVDPDSAASQVERDDTDTTPDD